MQSDLKTLEFDGIRRILARLALTPYGNDAAHQLEPAPDLIIARAMQRSIGAARRLVDAGEMPRLGDVPDVRAALRQAGQTGSALSATAFHHIRQVVRVAADLHSLAERHPDLSAEPAVLLLGGGLIPAIDQAINAQGRLRDDASEPHRELNARFGEVRAEVEAALHAVTSASENRGLFEGSQAVQWHGMRGVLAVRTPQAEKIKGVRRGTSAGGRDTLIEPIAAVSLNNRLETISGQIEAQNQLVLRQLTDLLRDDLPVLHRLIDEIIWTDLALAGGQLSAAMNASAPELVDQPVLRLEQVYHPQLLLQFQQRQISHLVPLTLDLNARHPMLVITGPNTGGKTVVLKTAGLLATMAHCGLHLPAEGACTVGNFTRVIVDVGDKQSLHHHLSTFAGHVEVLKRLLTEADDHTLVLMDELGTGTDPEEGASLAMAVLDELSGRRVMGIVTTHLTPLKGFADQHAWLSNACMKFDFETLSPTYQLELGHAGQSLGLIIAEKNGLPAELVARARQHLAGLRGEK